ncbi:MAG: serpin family protein [Bacteroidales bacterium]|nr:serpin family protein [Bacteroidales bacterium]
MKWLIKTVSIVLLGMGCFACSSDETSNEGPINPKGEPVFSPLTLTPAEVKLGVDIRKVGINLFQAQSEDNANHDKNLNTLLSPWNQYMFLAMLMNGANDSVQQVVMSQQGISSMGEMNEYMKRVTEYLSRADARVSMSSFNSFWYDRNLSIDSNYESLLRNFYNAEVYTADLGSSEGTQAINAWGNKVTKGYLEDFLPDMVYYRNYFLASAMVFEGQWEKKFTRATTEKQFHNLDGATVTIPMMTGQLSNTYFFQNGKFSKTSIPYGNGAYSMTLILPKEGYDPLALLRDNDVALFADMEELRDQEGFFDTDVYVTMPMMDLKAEGNSNNAFTRAGYGSLLDRHIPLENMGECGTTGHYSLPEIVINRIHVIVNEEGTKVISATHSGDPTANYHQSFIVDRPFICYISEKSTNAIVFAGVINTLK